MTEQNPETIDVVTEIATASSSSLPGIIAPPDINTIFDEIALSEEKISEESYQKGYEDGVKEGNTEGYHLGYHRGAELGAELGYYYGLISKHSENSDSLSDRVRKAVDSCLQLITQFPKKNDETVDIFALVDNIRAQYKKTCALLKVNGRYPEASDINF